MLLERTWAPEDRIRELVATATSSLRHHSGPHSVSRAECEEVSQGLPAEMSLDDFKQVVASFYEVSTLSYSQEDVFQVREAVLPGLSQERWFELI